MRVCTSVLMEMAKQWPYILWQSGLDIQETSLSQTRCAVLPISSLLAMLETISVLLTRLKQTCGGKKSV